MIVLNHQLLSFSLITSLLEKNVRYPSERHLSLSHKKTRRGEVSSGFHFLGVYYAPTQPESNTTAIPVNDTTMANEIDQYLCHGGVTSHQQQAAYGFVMLVLILFLRHMPQDYYYARLENHALRFFTVTMVC